MIASVDAEYVRGVGKQDNRLVILLDLERVLTTREINSLAKVDKRGRSEEAKAA